MTVPSATVPSAVLPSLFVKLTPGRSVRDPQTGAPLPSDGSARIVPNIAFWRRRLRDGDVMVVATAATAAASASSPVVTAQ